MHASRYFISTLKEAPADAELISHQLMVRAGLIKRLGSGLYHWMPLGLRVLRKIEAIVRQEMEQTAQAIELLMPCVQPAELWQLSGRWQQYGRELLRLKDRHDRDFVFGPTHEEVITDIVRREINSYRQLPINFYQIQTKFRDEIRPRFGVMRAREFLMKDGYSFHADLQSLEATYQAYYNAYQRIFTQLGLRFRVVSADTGSIGGTGSHEFHVLAASGEDALAFCPNSGYAANVELAEALAPAQLRPVPQQPLERFETPAVGSIDALCSRFNIPVEQTVKSLLVKGRNGKPVLLCLRGDHSLNTLKAEKLPEIGVPLGFSDAATVLEACGAESGFLGPVGFKGPIIIDRTVDRMGDFVVGANESGWHLKGVNIGRDFVETGVADLRNVVDGDLSPDGQGKLEIVRGIEVGHIFQLRTKYATALNCCFLDAAGQSHPMEMGCYGIGISRIVAAAIEQHHDDRGIIFPQAMAPFTVVIVPLASDRSAEVQLLAARYYQQLIEARVDVLLDDREERAGVKLADAELIGIPHRLTIGIRGLAEGIVEYQHRAQNTCEKWPIDQAFQQLLQRL